MKPKRSVFAFLLVFSVMLAGCNIRFSTTPEVQLPPPEPGTEAQRLEINEVAESIVAALDRGEFDAVWEASGRQLKGSAGKRTFSGTLSVIRKQFQTPDSRQVAQIGFANQVDPGGPKGEYGIVWFDTTFGDTSVSEKVVMEKESGQWKLAGYFFVAKVKKKLI